MTAYNSPYVKPSPAREQEMQEVVDRLVDADTDEEDDKREWVRPRPPTGGTVNPGNVEREDKQNLAMWLRAGEPRGTVRRIDLGPYTPKAWWGWPILFVLAVIFLPIYGIAALLDWIESRRQLGRGTNLSAGRADKTSTSDGATTRQLPQAIQPTPPGPRSGRQP